MMENKNRIVFILVGLLVAGNALFAYQYFVAYKELQTIKSEEAQTGLDQKMLNFTAMFINKVLKADKEVDFETRLSLENAVRELKDDEVMAEWQNFTDSKTEAEAQNNVKNLLGLLVSKMQK